MPDPVLLEQKRALRRAVRAAAAGFYPQHGAAYSRRLFRRLVSLPEYQTCRTLFCFVGTGCEADTLPLIRHALQSGRRVAVPLCTGPGRMEARLVPDLSALASRGAYGIPEPAADAPLLDKEAIDFAVVPCLCCDREGLLRPLSRGRRLPLGGRLPPSAARRRRARGPLGRHRAHRGDRPSDLPHLISPFLTPSPFFRFLSSIPSCKGVLCLSFIPRAARHPQALHVPASRRAGFLRP